MKKSLITKNLFFYLLLVGIFITNIDARVKHHSKTPHHGKAANHGGGSSHVTGGGVAPQGDSGVTPTMEGQSGQQPGVPIIGMPNPNSSPISNPRNMKQEVVIKELNLEKAKRLLADIENLRHNVRVLHEVIGNIVKDNYEVSDKSRFGNGQASFDVYKKQEFDPTKQQISSLGAIIPGVSPEEGMNVINPFSGKQIELLDIALLASFRETLLELFNMAVMVCGLHKIAEWDGLILRRWRPSEVEGWIKAIHSEGNKICYVNRLTVGSEFWKAAEKITSSSFFKKNEYKVYSKNFIDRSKYEVSNQLGVQQPQAMLQH